MQRCDGACFQLQEGGMSYLGTQGREGTERRVAGLEMAFVRDEEVEGKGEPERGGPGTEWEGKQRDDEGGRGGGGGRAQGQGMG